jgi:hypothetical protein
MFSKKTRLERPPENVAPTRNSTSCVELIKTMPPIIGGQCEKWHPTHEATRVFIGFYL